MASKVFIHDKVRATAEALRTRGVFIKGDPGLGHVVHVEGEMAWVKWERPSYPWEDQTHGGLSINVCWIKRARGKSARPDLQKPERD